MTRPAPQVRAETTPEQVDLAGALVRLADRLDGLSRRCRGYAAGLVLECVTEEMAEALAAELEEAAEQVRLHGRPVIFSPTTGQ